MSDYRRRYVPGGTYFFTLVTYRRRRLFTSSLARQLLRDAIRHCRQHRPFEIDAIVLIPDHMHIMMTLPPGDRDYPMRWNHIKRRFTMQWRRAGGKAADITAAQARDRHQGVWQPRYWEHTIRDEDDFANHFDYTHFNPVKHGYVDCPQEWPWSSFHRYAKLGVYDRNWACQQRQRQTMLKRLDKLGRDMGE